MYLVKGSRDERAAHRVVVLGASGLLGHVVVDLLLDRGFESVTAVMRRPVAEVCWWPTFGDAVRDRSIPPGTEDLRIIDGVDANDWAALQAVLDQARPDTIVNCMGVTPRRSDAHDVVSAIRVNALLPHLLATWSAAAGCRLITISTDCVFGHEPGGFSESDTPTAMDLYGRTKALGEVIDDAAVTIRTSFIGRELTGHTELLDWFLSRANGVASGFNDVWYSGVPVHLVASVIETLSTTHRHVVGLHHLAAREPISKCELLSIANEAFGAGVTIVPDDSTSSHRTIDGTRLRELIDIGPFTWARSLADLAHDRRYDLCPAARSVT